MTHPTAVTVAFVTCYVLALGIEILRLRVPKRGWRALAVLLTVVGATIEARYLCARAVAASASPLSSPHDWYLLAGWALALLYLVTAVYRSQIAFGLFLLPLALGLIISAQFADPKPFAPVRASRFWGNIHGTFLLLGTVTVTIGFVAGLMYLVQSYRLKKKHPPNSGFRLPSLEWLELVNTRSLTYSVLLVGIGVIAGIILNRIRIAGQEKALPWTDPVVISSTAMFAWLIVAELFRLLYRAARRGRKVAYLTLASFLFLVIALSTLLFVKTGHGSIG
ncbi:MAG: cytochrome c biogenesis protein CcsA [Pirellulales bacterium]